MKWIAFILIAAVGILLFLTLVGLMRPKRHVARGAVALHASPQQVWDVLADFAAWPKWNSQAREMVKQPDRDGHALWTLRGSWGDMPLEVTTWEPSQRLQTTVDAGAFRGVWTYDIISTPSGCRLMITEEGEVANPLFRGMMIFLDHHATMRGFAAGLAKQLGEPAELEKLP